MHIHNADPRAGIVCSHMVTEACWAAFGIITEVTDKIVGTTVVMREGVTHREAIMTAWAAGQVRICTAEPRVIPNRTIDPEWAATAFAWAEAHLG